MITFTNPRISADFDDWPSGRDRVKCSFRVDRDKRGWRISRTTTNKHGAWCKPKLSTYSGPAAIVDGSDGKTYILQIAAGYGFISIHRHDFMCPTSEDLGREPGKGSSVFERDEPELYKALFSLILNGGASLMYLESR